jgi:glycosyltransferase involved in cell wall biosynthesis
MRVLHVTPSVPQVRGGTSQAVLGLVKALCQHQVEAEIATTDDNGDDLLTVPLQTRVSYEQVPVWFFHRFSPPLKPIREFAFSGGLTAWLWQNMANYDLVHVHALFSYPSTVAMAIARLQKIPYVVSPHGLLCEWSLQQSVRKKQIYRQLIEQKNLNGSQAIHFTAEQEQQEAAGLNISAPSFIIPLGLTLPAAIPNPRQRLRQQLQIPEQEFVVLFMSRLHPKKGLDYLIQALGQLTHERFTFILAGSGAPEYLDQVKSLLTLHQLSDRTHLAGFVEGETKNLFLQGSDLFALPSYSENFGVVVLEAMAAKLPVLLTPGVALAPMVQQHQVGWVVEQDVKAITTAIADALHCPNQGKEMGERAEQLIAEQFSWSAIATQMEHTYQTILQKKPLAAL